MSPIDNLLINRINFLAEKKKEDGLSKEEQDEQTKLRSIYIKEFRAGFKSQLTSIKVVDKEGNDVTPAKLKEEKLKKQ